MVARLPQAPFILTRSLATPPPKVPKAASTSPNQRATIDVPREQFTEPAVQTLAFMGRTIKLVSLGALGIALLAAGAFEGFHQYVERYEMSPASAIGLVGPEGWEPDNDDWSGGLSGGTDRGLGWKGRHCVRGAYVAQEFGSGIAPGVISAAGGESHFGGVPGGLRRSTVNRADSGFAQAEAYLVQALAIAVERGRPLESIVALRMRLAGVRERLGGPGALAGALDEYETVWEALRNGEVSARVEVARRAGEVQARRDRAEDAERWFLEGLKVALGKEDVVAPEPAKADPAPSSSGGWFSRAKRSTSTSSASSGPSPLLSALLPAPTIAVSPPYPHDARAFSSLLLTLSRHYATQRALSSAHAVEQFSHRLLSVASAAATHQSPSEQLHALWVQHRLALTSLHLAEVTHALGGSPVTDALGWLQQAERLSVTVRTALESHTSSIARPPKSTALRRPRDWLERDARRSEAEAAYLAGLLHELSGQAGPALACYERSLRAHGAGVEEGEGKADENVLEEGGPEVRRVWDAWRNAREKVRAQGGTVGREGKSQ